MPSGENKARKVRCVSTGTVYRSVADAERNTGIQRQNIYMCAWGKQETAGGESWEYVSDDTPVGDMNTIDRIQAVRK